MIGIDGSMFVVMGAVAAAALGAIGSGMGIGRTTAHAGGILSEKPELFGKMLILMALPGTQGIYSLVLMFLMLQFFGFISGNPQASLGKGLAMLVVGICIGIK